jgi:hypothetical protein
VAPITTRESVSMRDVTRPDRDDEPIAAGSAVQLGLF